jgi:hypothetical protein
LCVWKLIIPELFHFNTCVPEMFNTPMPEDNNINK